MISIVIPTCHRNEQLALCLDRLAPGTQTAASNLYRVIVTDDGLKTKAEDLVRTRFPWAQWTAGPRRGPAANRNHGASIAAGEWLLFLDDDCLPSAGLVGSYLKLAENNPDIAVMEGCILPEGKRRHPAEECPINENGGRLWSCNFAIKADSFAGIGRFDERFPFAAMEDSDLNYRLRSAGVPIAFNAEAVVTHPWKRVNPWTHRPRHLKSELIYLQLHPEERVRVNWRSHLRVELRHWLKLFPRDLLAHPIPSLASVPSRIWDGYITCFHHARQTDPEKIKTD
jgi:GT2 family glycosyltransferase